MPTRREVFRPIIARVLASSKGQPLAVVRAALRHAFPCPPRKHHPYKVWLDEIRVQLGLKHPGRRRSHVPAHNQTSFFQADEETSRVR